MYDFELYNERFLNKVTIVKGRLHENINGTHLPADINEEILGR